MNQPYKFTQTGSKQRICTCVFTNIVYIGMVFVYVCVCVCSCVRVCVCACLPVVLYTKVYVSTIFVFSPLHISTSRVKLPQQIYVPRTLCA